MWTAKVALLAAFIVLAAVTGIEWVSTRGGSVAAPTVPSTSLPAVPGSTSPRTNLGSTDAIAAAVTPGVVDINTFARSSYAGTSTRGEPLGAGTGMILSSSGEVLTNNHVIEGATSIRASRACRPTRP